MKTKISITTLLAIAIQVSGSGQDLELRNTHQQNNQKKVVTASRSKAYESQGGSHKILAALHTTTVSESLQERNNLSNKSTLELLQLSEELNRRAQLLRHAAAKESPRHKNLLLEEAATLDEKALLLQITVSQMHAELNSKSFQNNRVRITVLIQTWQGSELLLENSYELIADSEKEMKLAKELREEAFAQPNPASVMGSLGNAEEKEINALHIQNQVITALSKSPALAGNPN